MYTSNSLFKLFHTIRSNKLAQLFVVYLRYLIGSAFAYACVIKIQGRPFTLLPLSSPVGYFFDALHRTGLYWQFLGWAQLAAATLLITQRYAFIGACIFFGIISNIVMITLSINFGLGTPILTICMLTATGFLLLWDFPRLALMFMAEKKINVDYTAHHLEIADRGWWQVTGLLLLFITIIFALYRSLVFVWLLASIVLGLVSLAAFFLTQRKRD